MAKKRSQKLAETDLYPPVYNYLIAQGYTVRSEVNNCDITAVKGEKLVIVELKRRFDTSLLIQAARRQRITDSVYVALPFPEEGIWTKRWIGIKHLLRRIEVGLILISFKKKKAILEILFHPLPFDRKKRKSHKKAILEEMDNRSGDFNRGGSVGTELMTAYRENVIHVACALDKFGCLKPRELRTLGTGPKTYSILRNDFYGWFECIARGVYRLKPQGKRALNKSPELVRRCSKLLEQQNFTPVRTSSDKR
ncbi:MAG: DUF2161 family putative PD-(D/E)XK-type phosphodiesterase [Planctomycetota bacterium]